MGLDWAQKIR